MQDEPSNAADSRRLVKTGTPGIYKRGSRYVVTFRANGKQRKEFAPTLAAARRLKAARQTDVVRGEFHEQTRVTLHEYATEWIDRYTGTGRGFRESTREDYRRDLHRYAFRFFDQRRRLSQISPRDIANYVAWLCVERHAEDPSPTEQCGGS